jgi:hypothetical protein
VSDTNFGIRGLAMAISRAAVGLFGSSSTLAPELGFHDTLAGHAGIPGHDETRGVRRPSSMTTSPALRWCGCVIAV